MKRALALAALLLLIAPVGAVNGANAAKASDSEAFAAYASEWSQDRTAMLEDFFAYKYEKDAALKSTLAFKVQDELTAIEKRLAKADVRECFENYAGLVDEFVATLIRYFEVVGPNPALAEAQYAYAGSLFSIISGATEDTLLACAPKEKA